MVYITDFPEALISYLPRSPQGVMIFDNDGGIHEVTEPPDSSLERVLPTSLPETLPFTL